MRPESHRSREARQPTAGNGRAARLARLALFAGPALAVLAIWVVYPTFWTLGRSLFDATGSQWVGLGNYLEVFDSELLLRALRNSAIWLAVVPALVTVIGLVLAVLTERISWVVAFRAAVFMPMAISAFAAGVTFRVVYQQDPDQGALNAAIVSIRGLVGTEAVYPGALPSTDDVERVRGNYRTQVIVPGEVARIGLTGIRDADTGGERVQASAPAPLPDGVAGVVWRDFLPGGGTPGELERGEVGLAGIAVELRTPDGTVAAEARTGPDGRFAFDGLGPGARYAVVLPAENFARPFAGVSWLGPQLITPSLILAYVWIWAGFAMVVIAAGLAAIPRNVLEAARTEGASEWQVFRRITVPLLGPTLTVVMVTMLINVLKVFDTIVAIAPGSVQDDAIVLALAQWRTSFGGDGDLGVGSALAVLLFVLVLPILALNVRRIRRAL